MEQQQSPRRGIKGYFGVYLKGIAMGSADVVPGVSGGTIALLVGIYDELITSISNAGSKELFQVFRRGGLAAYWEKVHGGFLLALILGVGTALFSLAKLIGHLLDTYPEYVWSFFLGLILASILFVGREVERWGAKQLTALVLGVVAGWYISTASPLAAGGGGSFLGYFAAGAVAICAMVLPGISGSFILLLLGKYRAILEAIHSLELEVLLPVGLGAAIGLLSFARLLSWLLARWRSTTMATLTGFIIGAIVRVWPWQLPSPEVEGLVEAVSPAQYQAAGLEVHWLATIALICLGFGVVLLLEKLANRGKR
ncbi:MAG: DUF368 domain-containing protein [Bacteroidetes bacterium]|nr:MAG: DUF368 domain-containing protein [Bacteroidota bacterium]